MPFSLRRDSEIRPSQKSSQMAPCFFRSIRTPTLRPFPSVTNWIPVMDLFSFKSRRVVSRRVVRRRGQASAGSIPWVSSSCASTLRGVGRPTGGLNAELLCVLGVQSLPAAELHGLGADKAADRSSAENAIQNIETNVPARRAPRDEASIDIVPQRQARAAAKGFEFPPDIAVLKRLGSVGSRHRCYLRPACSHPGEIHLASNRTQAPIGYEGRPLAQMRRIG